MDHLLSKEKKRCVICLVLSVLKEETLEENIENWIIKKTFLQKKIDEETRSRRDKVDSSSQEVIKN